MNISELKPSFDDIIYLRTFPSDIWQDGRDGVPHQKFGGYNGEKIHIIRPEFAARKYKNRLFKSATITLDSCGNIKTFDAHYGHYSCDGYTIRHYFSFLDVHTERDISEAYRC